MTSTHQINPSYVYTKLGEMQGTIVMRKNVSELNMVIVCRREEVSPTPRCCMPLDKSNTHAWIYTILLTAVVFAITILLCDRSYNF